MWSRGRACPHRATYIEAKQLSEKLLKLVSQRVKENLGICSAAMFMIWFLKRNLCLGFPRPRCLVWLDTKAAFNPRFITAGGDWHFSPLKTLPATSEQQLITESQDGWGRKGPLEIISSSPQLKQGQLQQVAQERRSIWSHFTLH